MIPDSAEYPIRINKYLALHNYTTRKGADDLIRRRAVTINGAVAKLGALVKKGDSVKVTGTIRQKPYEYLAYYKPREVITHSPRQDEESIQKLLGRKDIFPVGRLDKDSEGLIILTNDGRITDKLLNPKYDHQKEYLVQTKERFDEKFLKKMSGGVRIEGYLTKPAHIKRISHTTFVIILSEGKKHQIRRMCAALHHQVARLRRIRIMNINLDDLKPNQWRPVEGDELKRFLKSLGV